MGDGEQLIRDVWRRWNDGERDFDPATLDPEIEIDSALAGVTFSGESGLRSWIAEIDEQFESWELTVGQIRATPTGSFVVRGAIHARGRQSGVDLDQPASWLVEMRGGRLLRIRNFIGSESAAGEAGG